MHSCNRVHALKKEMEEQGLGIHESEGINTRILGLVGDTSVVDMRHIMANSIVENVQRIQEPYKKANRKFHPNDTVVDVNGVKIGGGNFQVIAGPCSIETKEQITEVANDVKNSGAGLLMSAEYIMAGGNENVILCERGIRTYETAMRNTLDLSAIPMIKKKSHLPVMVDPSHATGIRDMVEPMALAAIAAGADGLMVEVHNDPAKALCDGPQSLTPEQFDTLMKKVNKTREFFQAL